MENNNKLIAQFMGNHTDEYGNDVYVPKEMMFNFKSKCMQGVFEFNECEFHTDWNWLMPVVERIQSMGYWVDYTKGDVFIYDDEYNLVIPNPMHENKDTKLSIHYKIVIEFIKWYNNKQ